MDKGKEELLECYYKEKNKIEEEIEQLLEMKKHCFSLQEEFSDIQYYRREMIKRIDIKCSDCRTAVKYCEGMSVYLFGNEYANKLKCFDVIEQKISSTIRQLLFKLNICKREIQEMKI